MSFGNGKSKYDFVIFTDPECPFCKKAEDFFATKDVRLYINFLPLEMHPNARNMSLQILSSSDPKSTAQKIKNFEPVDVEITDVAKNKLSKMESLAHDLKITGTPKIFVIDNDKKKIIDVINGANIPQIEKYFN
jgi:thiol:disulfide interchange protein DsbC